MKFRLLLWPNIDPDGISEMSAVRQDKAVVIYPVLCAAKGSQVIN